MNPTNAAQIKADLAVIGEAINTHTPAPQPLREFGSVAGYVLNTLAAQPSAGAQGEAETLRVLLDNLVISQSLSKALREKATDDARSYLYDLRHRATPAQPDTSPNFLGHLVLNGKDAEFYPTGQPVLLTRGSGRVVPVYDGPQNVTAQPDTGDVAAFRAVPADDVPDWSDGIVTDGHRVAFAQKSEADHGGTYWACDGGEGCLEWEPDWFIDVAALSKPTAPGSEG